MNLAAVLMAFRLGVRQGLLGRMAVVGPLVIFVALTVSYGAMLKAVSPDYLKSTGLTPTKLVWYVILTEMVAMVSHAYFQRVQRTILDGGMETWLLRPIRFWTLWLAEWTGQELVRLVPGFFAGLIIGCVLTRTWMLRPAMLLALVPSLVASTILMLCACFALGAAAAWLKESRPLFWIYQKLLFLLGALLWPLALYPHWLRMLAWLTPFPAILAVPGNLALEPSMADVWQNMSIQVAWMVITLLGCETVGRALRRRLTKGG